MTTIAYKDGIIAWDSRMTRDGMIVSDQTAKMIKTDSVIMWMAGSAMDAEKLAKAFPEEQVEAGVFDLFVFTGGCLFLYGRYEDETTTSFIELPTDQHYAIGSGCQFAIAAMDHGKTAAEAVAYAKTRDAFTGGKVHKRAIY